MADEVVVRKRGVPFPKKESVPSEAAIVALVPHQITNETAIAMVQKGIEVRRKVKNYRAAYTALEDEMVARGWEPNPLLILAQIANEGYTDEVRVAAAAHLARLIVPKPAIVVKGMEGRQAPAGNAMAKLGLVMRGLLPELEAINGQL